MHPRTILAAALLAGLTLAPRCATRPARYASPRPVIPSDARDLSLAEAEIPRRSAPRNDVVPAPDPFRETIRPIHSARCGQCHDPGGRMYARLPFDDREVVSSHSAGILRRLKGDDRAAMERWLAGLPPAAGQR